MNQNIKVILVMSGKGGVGKTTVSVNLAYSLFKQGYKIGLLDIDIHGPNIPKMLNIENKKIAFSEDKMKPIKLEDKLEVMSVGFLVEKENAIIWRGPLKHKMIKQFVNDVKWSEDLDYLIVDLPPGTGDESISIAQLLNVLGVVIVATPQRVVILDVIKSINFCKKMNLKIVGLVENMSGDIFGSDTILEVSNKYKIPYLGKLSLSKEIAKASDSGKPFVEKEGISKDEFQKILDNFKKKVK